MSVIPALLPPSGKQALARPDHPTASTVYPKADIAARWCWNCDGS
jgi:hypothetical protein